MEVQVIFGIKAISPEKNMDGYMFVITAVNSEGKKLQKDLPYYGVLDTEDTVMSYLRSLLSGEVEEFGITVMDYALRVISDTTDHTGRRVIIWKGER